MRRLPRTHKKLAMAKSEEPDFFELEKTSPLPTLDQAKRTLESRKMVRLREHFDKDTIVRSGVSDQNTSHNKATNLPNNEQSAKKKCPASKEVPVKDMGGNADDFSSGMSRSDNGHSSLKVPDSLFQLQQDDQRQQIKDQLTLQSRVSAGLHQAPEGASMMRHQGHDLLARHHRAQMMQHLEQEQYLRAQSVHQAEMTQHQHNSINLLRQMEFLQHHHQRNAF